MGSAKGFGAFAKEFLSFATSAVAFAKDVLLFALSVVAIAKDVGAIAKDLLSFATSPLQFVKDVGAFAKNVLSFAASALQFAKDVGAIAKDVLSFVPYVLECYGRLPGDGIKVDESLEPPSLKTWGMRIELIGVSSRSSRQNVRVCPCSSVAPAFVWDFEPLYFWICFEFRYSNFGFIPPLSVAPSKIVRFYKNVYLNLDLKLECGVLRKTLCFYKLKSQT